MKQAKNPSDIPEGHHYAIIIFKSSTVHIPGDERSRTNPGHGYPASTETYSTNEYSFTHNRDEWVKEIQKMEKNNSLGGWHSKEHYAALEVVNKASIKVEVVVK